MARILPEDIAAVRDRARIDEVISEQVTPQAGGGGSLKGLCPFHDERSPSFHVTPAKGLYHCFGCQAGGDVIDFVMKTDMVTFSEAVEKLAARFGVTLRYTEGGPARGAAGATHPTHRGEHRRCRVLRAQPDRSRGAARAAVPDRAWVCDRRRTVRVGFALPAGTTWSSTCAARASLTTR